jgi:hypothetical protein
VRSLVEAQISRIKRCIGESLLTQKLASQDGEGVIIANGIVGWVIAIKPSSGCASFSRGGAEAGRSTASNHIALLTNYAIKSRVIVLICVARKQRFFRTTSSHPSSRLRSA